jgi:hypothetical protein
MSHSDEPPKRTLIGQDHPFQEGEDPADTARQPVIIPPGSESTLPLGSTGSLREALNQALAEGPAVAAARIQAARAAAVDASSTTPMGSAAIEHAATALDVPPPAKPIAFTARGTAPSQSELAAAIAKAANAHAERAKTPSSPLGEVAPRTSDPSIPRKPTTPGAAPAVSRTPTPGSPDYGTPMNLGAPSVATPMNLGAPVATPANHANLGYGAPVTTPASLPADSMFARQKPATGPNPVAFTPPSNDARLRPPTGPNAAVDPSAFAPRAPTPGTEPTALNMQAPRPNPASPYGLAPSAPGTERAALDLQPPYRPPTGPNPAVDPSRGRSPTGPTGTEPTAINMQAPPYNAAYDPSRGRPPTAPNPLAQGYDARAKPPTGPNPVEHNAKPGTNPNAAAYPQGSQYPHDAKPGTNPNAAAYPQGSQYPHDANAAAHPQGSPGSSPGAAAYAHPPYVAPHDATMMASPASQAAQLSPAAERPRVSTDPSKPITDTLREALAEHYEIGGEIARGGMGRILHAHDRRLGREVAIKELVGNSADFKARFERETLITARLQHPAIVPVYDAGRWPTGELFYTMKLVRGKPLEWLIEHLGSMRERIALVPNMIAVAEALAYAHSNNVVHRDLKPANILIGDFGETIVIDWGLAKDLSTNDVVEPAGPFRSAGLGPMGATVAGSVMGTPAYMPVEQGRGLQVDTRADVYAIGAVLYHVLSKRAPYEGPDGMSILQALLKEPPPPLTEIAPDVPPELATIVAKAMAREADARYPTALELVADLRRYQNGQMVGVHRYTSRELFKRWAKKHKGALTVATIAFVALVVVGVLAISRVIAANREAQREAAVALDQTETAQRALARAEASEARAKKSELTAADERDRQRFARERRVEFDHFAHTQRVARCAECHPTDPKTFTALVGHPGHDECQGACHEHDAKLMEGMSNDPKCAFCHIDRVATTKDHVSLRACDDSSMRAIKAMGGKVGPCFRHDSKAHRIADDGKPLECTTCHAVLADKTKWGNKSYRSLQELDTNTIIGQGPMGGTDAMHKACSTGCHAHEAETSVTSAKAACAKCHPQRSTSTF